MKSMCLKASQEEIEAAVAPQPHRSPCFSAVDVVVSDTSLAAVAAFHAQPHAEPPVVTPGIAPPAGEDQSV